MAQLLSVKHAAEQLGVSATGLRLIELRGEVHPIKNSSGRRSYDAEEIARVARARKRASKRSAA